MCEDHEIFDKQLFECCVIMVSILIKQYNNKMINITDFKTHTANKVSYILKYINIETNTEKRNTAENLVKEYEKIIAKS